MANFNQIKKHIINNLKAKSPFIVVESQERLRVKRLLESVAYELDNEIDYYCDSKQFVGLLDNKRTYDAAGMPVEFLADNISKQKNRVFVMSEIKYLNDDNAYSRRLLDLIYLAKENSCTLIIATSDSVWTRLSQVGVYLKLDLPNHEERKNFILQFMSDNKDKKIKLSEEDVDDAATLLSGFSEMQMSIMLSTALVACAGISIEEIHRLSKRKASLYGNVAGITAVDVAEHINVAGLENLKEWLNKKESVFFAPNEILSAHALVAPKGVLLGGIPGCGKSLSAKMIASTWKLPLYRFDIDGIFDKYVGESERNMRNALEYIDNISPCILWVDEIEKTFISSENTNEVSRRLLGQFLYWLQESKSRVFLVATANNVDILPPELFRKGRVSELFFMDLPNKEERKNAIEMYVKMSLHTTYEKSQIDKLVTLSKGYSFADIEMAIKELAEDVVAKNFNPDYELLEKSFRKVVSISKASPEMINRIQKWGKECAVNASKEVLD